MSLTFNTRKASRNHNKICFDSTLVLNLAILAWLHLCKEFTIFYFIMMLIQVDTPVGFIFMSKLQSRADINLQYLIMEKQVLCIIKELKFVFMSPSTGGWGEAKIYRVSLIGTFFEKGLTWILILSILSIFSRKIIRK